MSKLPNHYETLNVSNQASLEEIRAAYITLCKIFHPDLNPGMQDGLSMIDELTKAYNVLSDSNARSAYDLMMIESLIKKNSRQQPVMAKLPELPALPELKEEVVVKVESIDELMQMKLRKHEEQNKQARSSSLRSAAIAAVAVIGFIVMGMAMIPKNTLSRVQLFSIDGISNSNYVRPAMAPNGTPFPETTAYLSGYELRKNEGTSSVYVNNTKNDNDVYLKLISLEGNKNATVRHVFIKGKADFKIENLSTGKYEIQYLDLVAGLVGRSEIFSVEETKTAMGVKSSSLSVTLKTAVNGVMRVENVSIQEFNSLASL